MIRSVFDAAWRAAAYCVHPVVIGLSLLPLVLISGSAYALSRLYWVDAMDAVRGAFESWDLLEALFKWLASIGMSGLKSVLAPLVVVLLVTPVLVILSLVAVALLMAPAMLKLVARRRFPSLEVRRGGSFAGSVFVSLSATLMAVMALIVSIPFWLIPPVVLVVPPLIWGWLTYRVMSYDMLADHASKEERQEVIRRHRWMLLGMGVLTGYLGAAPSLLWISGALFVAVAPLLIPVAIWIYTLVFAFSALWFAHYLLAALEVHRAQHAAALAEAAVLTESLAPPDGPKLVR
ncbi:EI24 domain-containing protein [Piscinibacter sp. HJYY11]|uniref:EI24 domain-containing protein n=1 Tax=Piscinibacter sp. HJYY11 TaxID=2801333 RepID=UPI00191F1689|nr:EI24 domain-containing protein [Piscinibacter sp. HJYY11]MBL0730863.1 EI24 domain-containing protein [Piscinibacter sp. HJYY11]